MKEKIINGTFNVFTGPISDQSGNIKVNAGKKVSDAKLLSMDYFVEGVVGSIPE